MTSVRFRICSALLLGLLAPTAPQERLGDPLSDAIEGSFVIRAMLGGGKTRDDRSRVRTACHGSSPFGCGCDRFRAETSLCDARG